jgi:ATP-dependent helicase/nuclease subunit B
VIERVFLGDRLPLLAAVQQWLRETPAKSTWLVVEPDSVRRLERCRSFAEFPSVRLFGAQDASEALSPSMLSVDPLLRRQALWSALHAISAEDRHRFFPSADDDGTRVGWQSAVDAIDELFSELTTAGFCAEDVGLLAGDFLPSHEVVRWRVLSQIEKAFLAQIAARTPKAVEPPHRLVLAAVGDPPGRLRRWMNEHDDSCEIVALVAADESKAEMFDPIGGVLPRPWRDEHLPIDKESLIVAASASAQARAAYDVVEAMTAKKKTTVVLASLDEDLTPYIDAEGCRRGFCKPQGAKRLGRTAPFRLLHAVADYLEADGFGAFSALVRHPDFEQTLEREPLEGCSGCSVAEALADLDELAAQRLPDRIARFWDSSWDKSTRRAEAAVDAVVKRVKQLLDGLLGAQAPLTHWLPLVHGFLERVYGDAESWTKEPLVALRKGIAEAKDWPEETTTPKIYAAEAMRWLATRNATEKIDRCDDVSKVQRAEWPDAAWCDAESIVFVGFNEGRLPTSQRSGLFLPNGLRERLSEAVGDGRRLAADDLRYALDAYRLCTATAGRKEKLFVAGRFGPANEPLLPSRFWFARPAEEIPDRVARHYDPPPPKAKPATKRKASRVSDLAFVLPPELPKEHPPITSLRVTAFRDYLACPYRFFLRHVLKLRTPETPGAEMTGAQFGSLAHDVLERLAESDLFAEVDPERIFDTLSRRLDERAFTVFGNDPAPAVRIQIEQLRGRLEAFSRKHAAEVANGWRIAEVEQAIDDEAGAFEVDGEPFRITGRIDRIDLNDKTSSWRLLDYKTGDTAKLPDKIHRNKGEWVDLQLPLYWHLTQKRRGADFAGVGYVLMTKDHSSIGVELAPWNREEMEEAVAIARDVVRKIRRGEFWPPKTPPPDGFIEFKGLCRDGFRVTAEVDE